MKRISCILISLIMLLSFSGCSSDEITLSAGVYFADGDYEELLTPYLSLDANTNHFAFGQGSLVSYQEYGRALEASDSYQCS